MNPTSVFEPNFLYFDGIQRSKSTFGNDFFFKLRISIKCRDRSKALVNPVLSTTGVAHNSINLDHLSAASFIDGKGEREDTQVRLELPSIFVTSFLENGRKLEFTGLTRVSNDLGTLSNSEVSRKNHFQTQTWTVEFYQNTRIGLKKQGSGLPVQHYNGVKDETSLNFALHYYLEL